MAKQNKTIFLKILLIVDKIKDSVELTVGSRIG